MPAAIAEKTMLKIRHKVSPEKKTIFPKEKKTHHDLKFWCKTSCPENQRLRAGLFTLDYLLIKDYSIQKSLITR